MREGIAVLGSMATRGLLAELAAGWDGCANVQAGGGIEVARRVRDSEAADVVVLASGAMQALASDGLVISGSLTDIAVSGIAAAVRTGEVLPDLSDADAVKRAVLAAGRVGYSTGPSGDHLLRLIDGWGLRQALGGRLVQVPPGVPVGRLLAEGTVDLAFQQRSELMGLPGVAVAGPLPPGAQSDTVFTAGIASASARQGTGRAFIAFLASGPTSETKRRHGMAPA